MGQSTVYTLNQIGVKFIPFEEVFFLTFSRNSIWSKY